MLRYSGRQSKFRFISYFISNNIAKIKEITTYSGEKNVAKDC
jgi:hypothetical protein